MSSDQQREMPYVTGPRFTKVIKAVPYLRDGEEPLDRMAKWVLTLLIQLADWDTWETDVGHEDLARMGSMNAASSQRGVYLLCKARYIKRYEAADGGTWRTVVLADRILANARLFQPDDRPKRRFKAEAFELGEMKKRREGDEDDEDEGEGPHYEEGEGPHYEEGGQQKKGPASERSGGGLRSEGPASIYPSSPVSPRPSPERERGATGEEQRDAHPITRGALVEHWNGHSGRVLGIPQVTTRIAMPAELAEAPAWLARQAVDRYFEHALQGTAEWEPTGASWVKFAEWVGRIIQWIQRPSMPEPGMGRRFSEGRQKGGTRGRSTTGTVGSSRAGRHGFDEGGGAEQPAEAGEDLAELF